VLHTQCMRQLLNECIAKPLSSLLGLAYLYIMFAQR